MRCDLPYDKRSVPIELPDGVRVIGGRFPPPLSDHAAAVRRAITNPIGTPPLDALVGGKGRIKVLISDITRGGCLKAALETLLSSIERAGAGPERVEITIATGMHRGRSEKELMRHLGGDAVKRWTIVEHDARNDRALVDLGRTPAGTPCLLSERVVTSALVVCLGTISFHYFAGFGGGRKLIVPGVAGERTILANHRLSLKEDPVAGLADGCVPGRLDGNPVHEDMLAGAGMLSARVFAVNTIYDSSGSLLYVNAGDLDQSHREACNVFHHNFAVACDRPYGAVVVSAGGYPKDINLLQSHKAIRHASYSLKEGGLMLAAAACSEGIGSPSLAAAFGGGRDGVLESVRSAYTLNAQTAVSIHSLSDSFDIRLMSELRDEEVMRFGFTPWRSRDVSRLIGVTAPEDILLVMNGSLFLPHATGMNLHRADEDG